jgi:hypothetical protein
MESDRFHDRRPPRRSHEKVRNRQARQARRIDSFGNVVVVDDKNGAFESPHGLLSSRTERRSQLDFRPVRLELMATPMPCLDNTNKPPK